MPLPVAKVNLWGDPVGAVAWDDDRGFATFEYDPSFLRKQLEIAPLTMPLNSQIYSFPELNDKTFYGLPGLLADSLPDRYGTRLIEVWLQRQGRSLKDFSPIERLCYMGSRGMGALEFEPALVTSKKAVRIEVSELVELAGKILSEREDLLVNLSNAESTALDTIIRVGTSAGGARAKAVIAWNPKTKDVRSGQVQAPEGFEYWIIKFDGINDDTLGDPKGYGKIEYAYHLMATAAGIKMTKCRLMKENGRAHFMTRRFDRTNNSDKIHMQSFCALGHYDYKMPGQFGYETAMTTCLQLGLGQPALHQLFRRMVFNIIARNQDDHTRNIAFLMDRDGNWHLAPAFDVMWSYNSKGEWTNRHQMTINGKRDGVEKQDFIELAKQFRIKKPKDIIADVGAAIRRWPDFAKKVGVKRKRITDIASTHRLHLVP
ncbi:MAG: type II toxin-antitoxin system HipA family toxin [Desulfobacterales bacterium]|jgi:serine/threonine-protein kinase HipA|nr:type II toxin-antitoxin system HipA family toxin [Desulfobacterales bacterium]